MGETSLDTKTFFGIKLLCPDSALATAKITINLHNNDPFSTPACYSPTRPPQAPCLFSNFTFPPQLSSPLFSSLFPSKKQVLRNMDSPSERNQWQKCSGNQTGGKLGANRGQTGGNLKCAIAQHWMSESKVGQCLGASWDLLNSRYVPYLPIRSWFWAVRAWKEKFPRFKYIGLPTHFP